jgi:ribosomal protein S18 acetylase RimI-like enzyme
MRMMSFKKKIMAFAAFLTMLGGVCFVGYKYSSSYSSPAQLNGFADFNYDRDHDAIMDIFDKDYYWLVDRASSPNFSAQEMMTYLTTRSTDFTTSGKLTIKVLYDEGKLAGFTAYYMDSFYSGRIRFVAVAREFRSKGYGKLLTGHALEALQKRGAAKVRLITRVNNIPAQKAYRANGMVEMEVEDGFVYFEKVFKN